MLRNVPNSAGIVDDILCHGNEETTHDATVITLLETARANNLTFNANKFVFKSQDCAFFGGHLTPARYKMDPKKVQAISEMKPTREPSRSAKLPRTGKLPEPVQSCTADLTAPLRAPLRASFQLLKLENYCDDHTSLSSTTAVQI